MSELLTNLENFMLQLLATVDISSGVNAGLTGGMFLIMFLGEFYVQIPLLMEAIWLTVGYQAGINAVSIGNTILLFVLAQIARQLGVAVIYFLAMRVKGPLSRRFMKPLQRNAFYRKYVENPCHDYLRSLSIFSVTLGMMTWLNTPLKVVLALERRRKLLAIGTLISSAIFDMQYILLGAIFHTTTLRLTYLPMFLIIGLLAYTLLKFIRRKRLGALQ